VFSILLHVVGHSTLLMHAGSSLSHIAASAPTYGVVWVVHPCVTKHRNYAAFHWGRELVFKRSGNWWSPSWASQTLEVNWRETTETK